jgi:hypothetical protein
MQKRLVTFANPIGAHPPLRDGLPRVIMVLKNFDLVSGPFAGLFFYDLTKGYL